MKPELQAKYLQFISSKKNKEEGFTLIELLVVVIIIGVLAAVALPNLLGQVAKGRQAEAKNNLGAVNRAQQAVRLETANFAPTSNLDTKVSWKYYTDVVDGTIAQNQANYSVEPLSTYVADIKPYGAGVGTDGQNFSASICEGDIGSGAASSESDMAGSCTQGKLVE